jgi:chromosome segregation ATPase
MTFYNQEKLNKLRESHANLDANEGTFKATLKRTQLTLEREQDKNTELAKELNDVKRRNKDLTKQLEGWQNLERSESAEVESQRRQLASLQSQMQELTDVHEKDMDVLRRTLEKEQERLETCKEAKDNWEVCLTFFF